MRIVKAASEIILEDIRSCVYDLNTYPPIDSFLENVEDEIRDTLNYFLKSELKVELFAPFSILLAPSMTGMGVR